MRLRITRRTIGVLSVVALSVPFAASAAMGAPSSHRVNVSGTKPAWAQAAQAVGAPSAASRISFNVALPLRNAANAESLLQSVSSPSSASYGKYLSAAQFNGKYAPTAASVSAVRKFLIGAGLKVSGVAAGNRWVSASGTVAQINKAFATSIRTYNVKGQRRNAPASTLSVPSSIASDVIAVSGLTQALAHPNVVKPDSGSVQPADSTPVNPSACSTYWNQYQQTMPEAYGKTSFPTYICGYSPKQLRSAYDVQSAVSHGTNGKGVTVAIIDAYDSPTILADANQYATIEGDAPFKAGQFIDTSDPSAFDLQDECGDWSTEETLDVEAVHGMAPGATVHFFGANDCDAGIDDALNTVVQTHAASIVSNSYGYNTEELDPAEIQLEHSIFLQGDLEGMGFYFSSADDGDNAAVDGVNAPEPSYSSSDPLVTGVGGTSLAISSKNSYQFETGWGSVRDYVDYSGATGVYEDPLPGVFYAGAGGGVSTLFTEPWYQKGTVPNSLATSRGGPAMRVDPDISADADPYTGFAYGQTVDGVFAIGGVGGTSLACPLIAGIQADASTHRLFPIGFANPLLYATGGFTFRDVTPPSSTIAVTRRTASALVTLNEDTSLTVTKGYDDVTGIGTPRGSKLLLAEALLP
jgi:subtilase family serine protease